MSAPRSPYRQLQTRAKAAGFRANQSAAVLSALLKEEGAAVAVQLTRSEASAPVASAAPAAVGADAQRIRWLLVVVMIDLSAVALVVPLIPVKMRELGVRPELIGLIGSVYSGSQIVGGLAIGTLSDRVSRSHVLLLNFLAAAVSYTMVGLADSVWLILASRVVVGLFKQTMTLASAVVTDLTTDDERGLGLGQLRTTTTLAWTVGQLLGGVLASYHQLLPAAVCIVQYAVASAITLVKLDLPVAAPPPPSKSGETGPSVRRTAQRLMAAPGVAAVLGLMLLHWLLSRSLSTMGSYYELDRFELSQSELGYLNAYKTGLSLLVPVLLGSVMRGESGAKEPKAEEGGPRFRLSEANVLHFAVWITVAAHVVEAITGPNAFLVYLFCSVPLKSSAAAAYSLAIKTLFTKRVPSVDTGAALGLLDVLKSSIGVAAPLLGGLLLGAFGSNRLPVAGAATYAGLGVTLMAVLSCTPNTGVSKTKSE